MAVRDVVHQSMEAFNRHDAAAFTALYGEGATVHDPQYSEPLRSHGAIRKDIEDFFLAFPDVRASVGTVLASEESAAFEFELRGTHEGPLVTPTGDIPATHRPLALRGSRFIRVDEQGRITECNRYFDLAAILQQLALM